MNQIGDFTESSTQGTLPQWIDVQSNVSPFTCIYCSTSIHHPMDDPQACQKLEQYTFGIVQPPLEGRPVEMLVFSLGNTSGASHHLEQVKDVHVGFANMPGIYPIKRRLVLSSSSSSKYVVLVLMTRQGVFIDCSMHQGCPNLMITPTDCKN